MNTDDLIHYLLETVINEINCRKEIPAQEKKSMIVAELQKRGLFNIKSALDRVAKEIGVSRNTIYNYIREARVDVGTEK